MKRFKNMEGRACLVHKAPFYPMNTNGEWIICFSCSYSVIKQKIELSKTS